MEYTKDIILNVNYKKRVSLSKLKEWTCRLKKVLINNKFIFSTITVLAILMSIDMLLVNSFFQLLSRMS